MRRLWPSTKIFPRKSPNLVHVRKVFSILGHTPGGPAHALVAAGGILNMDKTRSQRPAGPGKLLIKSEWDDDGWTERVGNRDVFKAREIARLVPKFVKKNVTKEFIFFTSVDSFSFSLSFSSILILDFSAARAFSSVMDSSLSSSQSSSGPYYITLKEQNHRKLNYDSKIWLVFRRLKNLICLKEWNGLDQKSCLNSLS